MFFWLLKEQSKRLSVVADNSSDLIELISSFSNHVKAVYSLDSFYGDETLGALLEHARSFNEQLETFEYIYGLIEEDAENENTDPDAEEETS